MTSSLPPHLFTQKTSNAGTGLFTAQEILAGELIFRVERPLVSILDSARLRDTCEGCFQWLPDNAAGGLQRIVNVHSGLDEQDITSLKDCLGCKVVKYCSKACQTESWKNHHKYECKIFKSLYPKVLPSTVRLVLQLLLRRRAGSLQDEEWHSFLKLQAHLEEFKSQHSKNADGLTTWQTIELMSQATVTYSGSKEPLELIQSMIARVLVNTHTLTKPTLDPLGLCLSPISALLNHSCAPNAAITFSTGGSLALRSLIAIPSSTPIQISYIDTSVPTFIRIPDLLSRYHFTCSCPLCLAHCTSNLSNPDPPTTKPGSSDIAHKTSHLLNLSLSSSPSEALPRLNLANALFASCNPPWPPHRHPRAAIHTQLLLTALTLHDWSLALRHALVTYFHADPVLYAQSWHPVRVVRKWVLLKLALQIAEVDGAAAGEGGRGRGRGGEGMRGSKDDQSAATVINWGFVVWALWTEVTEGVSKSHGAESGFAAEVRDFGVRSGLEGRKVSLEEIQSEWVKLRALADEGLTAR